MRREQQEEQARASPAIGAIGGKLTRWITSLEHIGAIPKMYVSLGHRMLSHSNVARRLKVDAR
jgi:hypothetical protein